MSEAYYIGTDNDHALHVPWYDDYYGFKEQSQATFPFTRKDENCPLEEVTE